MFGNRIVGGTKGLNLGGLLNGLSRTLNVANRAIPIYMQVKPMIGNAKSALGMVKGFISTDKKGANDRSVPKAHSTASSNGNNPRFFL